MTSSPAKSLPRPLLRLVGGQTVIASDAELGETLRFYGPLFSRLVAEVKHTGELTRYVGYQSDLDGDGRFHFFGIEVSKIEGIPEGLTAWGLDDKRWTVWESRKGQDVIISREDVMWHWRGRSRSGSGRWTGEFAGCYLAGLQSGERAYHNFWISANSYVGPKMKRTGNEDVHLVDYDGAWSQQFTEMAAWLRRHLGARIALSVDHIGSTSIPGMPAKPVIDILVEIPSFREAKPHVLPLLDSETWEYWWHDDHMMFIKRDGFMGQRRYHVHMMPRGHDREARLAFRDHLRSHPEDASRYAALKQQLARSHRKDRERYTEAKSAFVSEIVSKALRNS